MRTHPALAVAAAATAVVALAGCSSGSGSAGSTVTTTVTASPTDTATTESPTSTTTSPTSTSTTSGTTTSTSGSPTSSSTSSTVSPTSSGSTSSVTVTYAPNQAVPNQRVSVVARTDASLAGKQAYVVKLNDGAPRVLTSGSPISRTGIAATFVQLMRTGVLKVVVPASPLAVGPYDPATPLLAESGQFTVTVG